MKEAPDPRFAAVEQRGYQRGYQRGLRDAMKSRDVWTARAFTAGGLLGLGGGIWLTLAWASGVG